MAVTTQFKLRRQKRTSVTCSDSFSSIMQRYAWRNTSEVVHPSRIKPEGLNFTSTARQSTQIAGGGDVLNVNPDDGPPCHSSYEWEYANEATFDQFSCINFVRPNWALAARVAARDVRTSLGSSLAEYRSTADMFVGIGKKMYWAYKQIRRGRLPSGKRSIYDVGSAHLMAEWGFKPLISDFQAALEDLRSHLAPDDPIIWFKVPSFAFDEYSNQSASWSATRYEAHAKAADITVMYIGLRHSKLTHFGNPLEWAWEVTPFSWFVDYFYNVGENLTAIDAFSGIEWLKGWVTRRVVVRQTGERAIFGSTMPPGGVNVINNPSTTMAYYHNRYAFTSVPNYTPQLIYDRSLSAKRIINTVAVFSGMHGSSKKRR